MFRQFYAAALLALAALGSSSFAEEPKATGGTNQITNSLGMKLTLIPSGEFMMGSKESAAETAAFFDKTYGKIFADPNAFTADACKPEHPQHRVRITRPFYLGTYHVTRGQFRRFVADTGYKTDAEKYKNDMTWAFNPETRDFDIKEGYSWRKVGFEQTDEHPVVCVSWNDAVAFCKWLSRKEGKTYRLPTEAEWEYACRAGTKTRYYSGDDPETLAKVGNIADAALKGKFPKASTIKASDGYVFTSPVGKFKANAFELYDMHGNAWQWCADWYDEEYYAKSPANDPGGPVNEDPDNTLSEHVLRGGCWVFGPTVARSAFRVGGPPELRGYGTGFRVARNQDTAPTTAAEKPPTKIWNRTGPLGDTPKHVTGHRNRSSDFGMGLGSRRGGRIG